MKTLLLIDANSFIHRAFHALPPLSAPDGRPTGALYGLASILLKAIREIKPDFVAAAFDRPEPTFRKKEYAEYKAHRPPAPPELISQLKEARRLFDMLGIRTFELAGYEADDILGSLAQRHAKNGVAVKILTGDLDTLQIVSNGTIAVETPKRGMGETVTYDEEAVRERFGIPAELLTDYKGLAGDQSDNIPGVPGIGPKTAAKLLQEYGSLESIVKAAPSKAEGQAVWKKIAEHRDQALLSKRLATLNCDVPIVTTLSDLAFVAPGPENVREYFSDLGFQSLLKRMDAGTTREQPKASRKGEAERALVCDENTAESQLQAPGTVKIALAWKPLLKSYAASGIRVAGKLFDISVAAWMLGFAPKNSDAHAYATHFLGRASEERDEQYELFRVLSERMKDEGVVKLFETVEMPLVPILAEMENRGIVVNREALETINGEIKRECEKLTEQIYQNAGKPFNINSPRDVGTILFQVLKLKPKRMKRTPLGQQRTDREVLGSLRDAHPVIPLILQYREEFKIQSGFIEPLIAAQGKDGRIHTTFLQTGTATGRLASEQPNLQNIPQESRWAVPIRNAFETGTPWSLVSLDYSQLELRLLAHESGDERLASAFKRGDDIHRLTAAAIFRVDASAVTPAMRRTGKTLNFGIVYGMGARAFSETAGVSREEAERFIDAYFKAFPKVKAWQENVKEYVALHGFVANRNGRKRWFPQGAARGVIERAAMNMPIQSLGADIIKQAMIGAREKSRRAFALEAPIHLLLSIHDELLFEVRDDILETAIPMLQESMEHAEQLSVPLIADVKVGKRWGTMHPYHHSS